MSAAGEVVLEAAVDRIEEGVAIVAIVGGGELIVPADRLPAGAGEGAALRIRVTRDPDREQELLDRTAELQRRLRGGEGGA